VFGLAHEDDHSLLRRPLRAVTIAQWLDTLCDLQDPLLLGSEEIEDTSLVTRKERRGKRLDHRRCDKRRS
jgi:hypothetical protein